LITSNILNINIIAASISVIALATSSCISFPKAPYTNHIRQPNDCSENVANDISSTFFVLIIFITCGMNADVVHTIAIHPNIDTAVII
jgi:hypothetical protein